VRKGGDVSTDRARALRGGRRNALRLLRPTRCDGNILTLVHIRAEMKTSNRGFKYAIEVFVRGHSAGRSRTFPYEVSRVGPLWVMRDAPRKNPRDYRKEEWIVHDIDAIARQQTRGRFFVCAMIAQDEPDEPTRAAYKVLGYRLLATEGFFVQPMKRIPRPPSPVSIERVRTPDLAAQLGKITRTRPISNDLLGDDAP